MIAEIWECFFDSLLLKHLLISDRNDSINYKNRTQDVRNWNDPLIWSIQQQYNYQIFYNNLTHLVNAARDRLW